MPESKNNVSQTIVEMINKVRTDSGRETVAAQESDGLTAELGLDSLDLAVLVVSLEKAFGVDPFRDGSATAQTLGELVAVYEKAVS